LHELLQEVPVNTSTLLSGWQRQSPRLLGLLRLVTAFLFIQFGTAKWFAFPGPILPDGTQVELMSQVGIAGLLEIVGGALLFIGLFTRPVAFILSGEMAFAYFIGHAPHGVWPVLNQGTPAVLFCFLFLYFSAAGPGAFAVANLLHRWQANPVGFAGGHQPLHHSR
jgi:putative oxidoreductase